MKLQEIKDAVDNGSTVIWVHEGYRVRKYKDGIGYYIICLSNDNVIGLTHQDGVTMNGSEEDFRIL